MPATGEAPLMCAFSSSGSTDDGVIVSRSWNFGDGSAPSSDPNPVHTFTSAGTFNVTLNVTDDDGLTGSSSVTVVVKDTTPPTISITSPVAGETVTGKVSVLVDASDNVGVTKVMLYVDGRLKAQVTASPFTIRWYANTGSHTLQTRAFDAAGNSSFSAIITVRKD